MFKDAYREHERESRLLSRSCEDGATVTTLADLDLYAQWEQLYTVTCLSSGNGTVTAEPAEATEGTDIMLTVQADENYAIQSLTVTDADGQTSTNTKSEFIDVYHAIPIQDGNVTVTDCRGLFLPSGSDCGHYGNDESYKMTLYPDSNGRKIILDFLDFKTQPNTDVLTIYDGTSTDAPLIGSYSGSVLPGYITASNPEGALTITFVSNTYSNYLGWIATVTCTSGVSVDENLTESMKIYPNPAQNSFTIEAKGEIQYSVYNTLGQVVLAGNFTDKTQIDAQSLRQGVYFLQLKGTNGNWVEKLIVEK